MFWIWTAASGAISFLVSILLRLVDNVFKRPMELSSRFEELVKRRDLSSLVSNSGASNLKRSMRS